MNWAAEVKNEEPPVLVSVSESAQAESRQHDLLPVFVEGCCLQNWHHIEFQSWFFSDSEARFVCSLWTLIHVKTLKDSNMCWCVPAVDHSNSYLAREQAPLKKQFLPNITAATRRMIYSDLQRQRPLHIEFVLQLYHTYKVGKDGRAPLLLQTPLCIHPLL